MRFNYHLKAQCAARQLRIGQVLAYPTEAVWGLGCDPYNAHAVTDLLNLKRRAPEKGLILVAAHIGQFEFLLHDLSSAQKSQLVNTWPGPSTWLVPHKHRVPEWISGAHSSVAIRVSAHPTVAALCESFGGALVSTSANPQGCAPARYSFQAHHYFGTHVSYAWGHVNFNARPSVIRDLISGRLIRS